MKKILASITLIGLLAAAVGLAVGAANAVDPVVPSVSAVQPDSAYNDIDSRITITGADFMAGLDGTPTVALQGTPLTEVTWVDTQTLTATVPWGMDPGVYGLSVTNPGGGSFTLPAAFTVTQGIGTWNTGELFGGGMSQLLLKPGNPAVPGDPDTLYALASVGLFRSTDGAATWQHVEGFTDLQSDVVLDPTSAHSAWLYYYSPGRYDGVWRSKDRGDTWTRLPDAWNLNGADREVFISPHNSNVIFQCAYPSGYRSPTEVYGLKRSTDGGSTWTSVSNLPVQSVAFDPSSASNMVLATSDGRVYESTNGGTAWSKVATPDASVVDIFARGFVTYNPCKPGEVWFSANANSSPHGLYRSDNADLTSWTKLPQEPVRLGVASLSFPTTGTVYVPKAFSTDGGDSWTYYGPAQWYGVGALAFAPGTTQTAYIADNDVGVRKTTNGGVDWPAANVGLTGLRCTTMEVSRADPLRVYTAFEGPLGIYRSLDGTNHWAYFPVADIYNVRQVLEDPFDAAHVYALTGSGLYESTTTCATWANLGWDPPAGLLDGNLDMVAADSYQQGHLLGSFLAYDFNNDGHSWLFDSVDGGKTWQGPVATLSDVLSITSIVFDPETTGTVYAVTRFSGLYRSTDSGASWTRIDDRSQHEMRELTGIAIATHPRHVLMVTTPQADAYRSTDGGLTWHVTQGVGEDNADSCVFVENDSSRLYAATSFGLYFSSDLGDSWTPAAGSMGQVEITAVNWAVQDGRAIIYTATTGLKTSAPTPAVARSAKAATSLGLGVSAAKSTRVGAGIYRRAQVSTSKTPASSGALDGWLLESGHTSSRGGSASAAATTFRLGDDASKRQYRTVLSFGTSSIPDGAVVTGVTLKIKRQGVTGGGDPVAKFGGFRVDVKKGFFGTRSALQAGDFQVSASKSFGSFKPVLTDGWYSIVLTGARAYINKTSSHSGVTQVRLRFALDDNGNHIANYLRLYSGNAPIASRPQLVVTYYTP